MRDPFGTAALRAAVLDSWAASPTRFREDANAEEDLRLGGYANAWFVGSWPRTPPTVPAGCG